MGLELTVRGITHARRSHTRGFHILAPVLGLRVCRCVQEASVAGVEMGLSHTVSPRKKRCVSVPSLFNAHRSINIERTSASRRIKMTDYWWVHHPHRMAHRYTTPISAPSPSIFQVVDRCGGTGCFYVPMQDAGHFNGNVAGTNHCSLLRLCIQVEESVGVDRMLDPWNVWQRWFSAAGDQDVLRL